MKQKFKSILIDLSLVTVIFLLLLLFHAVFIAGPLRAQEHEEKLFVEAFQEQYKLENVEVMNRFSLDEPYFIIKDRSTLYAFNKSYSKVIKRDYKDLEAVKEMAQSMGIKETAVGYGVFGDAIVYSLEKDSRLILVDIDTMKIVFE